jgi:hypothetical protein
LAAPVLEGMMLKLAALPPLQSLAEGPSTVFWVATHKKKQENINKHPHRNKYANKINNYIYLIHLITTKPVPVMEWTVVIKPSTMPNLSLMTLARGARQLVVQLALETMSMSLVYSFSFTPTTNMGASLLGAEMITFLAPPFYIKK